MNILGGRLRLMGGESCCWVLDEEEMIEQILARSTHNNMCHHDEGRLMTPADFGLIDASAADSWHFACPDW